MTRAKPKKARTKRPDASDARKRLAARRRVERRARALLVGRMRRIAGDDIVDALTKVTKALRAVPGAHERKPAEVSASMGLGLIHAHWDIDSVSVRVTIG